MVTATRGKGQVGYPPDPVRIPSVRFERSTVVAPKGQIGTLVGSIKLSVVKK
jgi:hypothetical protein